MGRTLSATWEEDQSPGLLGLHLTMEGGMRGRDEKAFESLPQQTCVLQHPTISISLVLKNTVGLGHCLSQRASCPRGVWLSLSVSLQRILDLGGSPKAENCLHRLHQSHAQIKHLPFPWAEIRSLGDQSHLSASESEALLGRVVDCERKGWDRDLAAPWPSNNCGCVLTFSGRVTKNFSALYSLTTER